VTPPYSVLLQYPFFRQATCSVCTSAKTHLVFSLRCCSKCSSTVPLRTSSTVLIGIRAGRSEVRTPEGKTFILQMVCPGCGAHPDSKWCTPAVEPTQTPNGVPRLWSPPRLQMVCPGCAAHPDSCPLDIRDFFPEVKWPGRGVNRSLPRNAEAKNERSYSTTPQYTFIMWPGSILLLPTYCTRRDLRPAEPTPVPSH